MSKNCSNIERLDESSDTVGESSGEDTEHGPCPYICKASKEENLSDEDEDEVEVNKVETTDKEEIVSKEIDETDQIKQSDRDNQIKFYICAEKQKEEKVKLKVGGQRSKKQTLARQWRLLNEKERRTTDKKVD